MKRYPSIDTLQRALGEGAFAYAVDRKKAAGRALGTFVELMSFYLLKSWGFERNMAIERGLPEFANPGISHNVEFTFHRSRRIASLPLDGRLPVTAKKLAALLPDDLLRGARATGQRLLSSDGTVKNACTIAESGDGFFNAYVGRSRGAKSRTADICELQAHPFAMVECKRVGVEDGQRKGPQTIEKAKQGAYVARTVSSLQRVRLKDGSLGGFAEKADGSFVCGDYYSLLREVISGRHPSLASGLTLTIGIVSNHGNWFTSENRNKELEVLAQSYDWLLFLSDEGLARFIDEVIFSEGNPLPASREAFKASYGRDKTANRFTKSRIDASADGELTRYFTRRHREIAGWFNLISPAGGSVDELKAQLSSLASAGSEAGGAT